MQVHVTAGSPLAELFLIDHSFALVDRSIGELDAEVTPGVYTVKARLGETTVERLVLLDKEQRVDLAGDLTLASPAPIEGTSQTHEYHVDVAVKESFSPMSGAGAGTGAEVFLMTRRWTGDGGGGEQSRSLSNLSLHRPDGSTVVDLDRQGAGDPDPAAGVTVAVDPGPYLVRWRGGWGITAEQSVQAVEGWQTQLFLLEEGDATTPEGRHVLSVLFARHGFQPDDGDLQFVEEARAALAAERKVASELANQSLFAKFDNPMLGLFGAHLMLIAKDALRDDEESERRRAGGAQPIRAPVSFDQELFDGAVENLRGLLGEDNPDVVALSTRSTGQHLEALEPVVAPPMLRRSWVLLVEASNDAPELVPAGLWRQVARLLPLRPFLTWSPAEHDAQAASAWEHEIARSLKEAAESTASKHWPDARRRLSLQLLAPRAAIDEMVGGGPL